MRNRQVRVDDETWEVWRIAAEEGGLESVSALIRTAVDAYLHPSREVRELRARVLEMKDRIVDAQVALEEERSG